MKFYGIWTKENNNYFWYGDLSNGIHYDGSIFPKIFTSIENAQSFAKSVNLHFIEIKTIDTSKFCDIVNENSSNQCKYCSCWKRIRDYE